MSRETVRTSLGIPVSLHRQLNQLAARQGCSARQLVLRSFERAIAEAESPSLRRRLTMDGAIVPSRGGGPITLTNEQVYDLIEFP